MPRKRVAIFGINVDQGDTAETIEAILEIIEDYNNAQGSKEIQSASLNPGYVATLNTDFLANTLNFKWNSTRHPELARILRHAALVTPDGMPIVFLAKLLGSPLKERVTGADLVPMLAEALGALKKKAFLLGGTDIINAEAKAHLEKINPGFEIVGTYAPLVMTEGLGLLDAIARDALILNQIHKASPDVLLISLGHPKQEVWFGRVSNQLRVPVAIGIGGALNFLTGHVKRAPKWMQSIGLEWVYRLYAEPKKLWMRYFYDALIFLCLSFPLILYDRLNYLYAFARGMNASDAPKDNLLFLSENRSVAVVRMPEILTRQNIHAVQAFIDEAYLQDACVIDFENTHHMDLEALSLVLTLWERAAKDNKTVIAFKVGFFLSLFFRLHRIWSTISYDVCESADALVHRLFEGRNRSSLYETYHQTNETLTISFLGHLENNHDYDRTISQMEPMLFLKDCRVDLTFCNLIEAQGFYFLLKLKQFVLRNGRTFSISGVSKDLQKQFKIARLWNTFTIE